jgi:hypothetical protein
VQRLLGAVETLSAAQGIDSPQAPGADEPRAWTVGHSVSRPLQDGGAERLLQRLLGEVEIAEEAHEGREDSTRLGAVDEIQLRSRRRAELAFHESAFYW